MTVAAETFLCNEENNIKLKTEFSTVSKVNFSEKKENENVIFFGCQHFVWRVLSRSGIEPLAANRQRVPQPLDQSIASRAIFRSSKSARVSKVLTTKI